MENREFYLEDDGWRIHCKLDYPDCMRRAEDRCPLLILVHGLTGHMEERHIVSVAGEATSIGLAVLRVELYGHGKSSGEFRKHTVLKWVDQMLTVVDWAASRPFVTDLYLAGHSQGGLVTILVGALERDRLKAIIPLAPAIVIRDRADEGQLLSYQFDPEHIPDEVVVPKGADDSEGKSICGNYFRVAQLLPVEESIRRYEGPVLIVHGDADEAVPVQYAYDAAKRYKNCTLKIIKGDTHCYDHHLDEVNAAVREFLAAQTAEKHSL